MGLFNFLFKKNNQEELVDEIKSVHQVPELEEEVMEEEVNEVMEEKPVTVTPIKPTKHPERKPQKEIKERVCTIKLDGTYSLLNIKRETDLKFEVGEGKLLIKSMKPMRHSKITDRPELGYKEFTVNNNVSVLLHNNGLIEVK